MNPTPSPLSFLPSSLISAFLSPLFLLLSPPTASAAVVTGNIVNTSGNPYVTNALFAPLSTPLASGTNIIASTQTNVVAAANGSFSVNLKQGNYLVTIGNLRHDSFVISVPNDANTYAINSLITNAITFNYTYSPVYEQLVNKGQADGYVGLSGSLIVPSGLSASNLTLLGSVHLDEAAASSLGTVPVGGIVAWDKSLPGVPALPANFVECNGQTISDPASPLNGQTVRNLNSSHQFLRGNTSSGTTGGSATHVHNYSGATSIEDGDTDVQSDSGIPSTVAALSHVHLYSGTTDSASSLPPYTDMVWIMRIK